jgi:hypothetical protein
MAIMLSREPGSDFYRAAAPRREVDPNAIRAELKAFPGLAEALVVDDKAEWMQGWVNAGRTIARCS